jgi:hypothetical protein
MAEQQDDFDATPAFYIDELTANTIKHTALINGKVRFSNKPSAECTVPVHWNYAPPSVEALRIEADAMERALSLQETHLDKHVATIATLEATNAAQAEQLVKLEIEAKYNFDLYQDLGQEMAKEPQAGVELTDEESTEIEGICYSIQECKLTPERAVRAIERALNQRQAVKAEPCPLCHGITVEERVQEENTAFEAGRKFERELSAAQGVPEEYYADENEIIVFYQAMNDAGREENWPCNMRHRINMGLSAIHKRRSAAPEQAEIKEGKL